MAGGSETPLENGSLEFTPTWAFGLVCGAFILVSLLLERIIHMAGEWVKKRPEKSLYESVDKIKEELMLLGFISLLLTVVQPSIAKICLPHSFVHNMLPCKFNSTQLDLPSDNLSPQSSPSVAHRRLMFVESLSRRILANAENSPSKCYSKGKVPFISLEGVHQIHIFIFVLAIGHIVLTCKTLLLARYQVSSWGVWEEKARSGSSPAVGHTFLRKHANSTWKSSRVLSWILCFFIHFGSTITYTEYHTLRHGFIQNHKLANTFDFHKYILRALESDFKEVVGISAGLWVFVVIYLILNVNGWYTYFWLGFIPLALMLAIGAKLHRIILKLANEIQDEQRVEGSVVVNLSNDLFWFRRPRLILHFFHFILFENAFEVAFIVWVWSTFGFGTCFRNKLALVITRLVLGLFIMVMFSYRTLPLYALVSQMGAGFKFDEKVQGALKNLRARAKKNAVANTGSPDRDGSSTTRDHPSIKGKVIVQLLVQQ